MRHLDDRRICPHCHKPTNERPYLMARQAASNVLSAKVIAWVVVAVVALMLIGS